MTRHSTVDGAYEIDSLPGQCQVAVCHSFFVREDRRGLGCAHHTKFHQRAQLALDNYDFAICTVSASNAAQKRVLEKAGWKKLADFRNSRLRETTELWGAPVK